MAPVSLLTLNTPGTLCPLPGQIHICVWNWHKCTHPHWAHDFTELARQTDLFLAQEVSLSSSTRQLLQNSPLQWQMAVSFLSPRKHIPTGIALGCRYPAQEVSGYKAAYEPLVYIPKMIMRAVYPIADTLLLVLNLHAINFTGITPFEHTLHYLKQLISPFNGPVLVAGDFNVWSHKRTDRLYAAAADLQLQEVSFQPDLRSRYLNHPVDYVFVRGLEIVQSSVIPVISSDHQPLWVTLRLPAFGKSTPI